MNIQLAANLELDRFGPSTGAGSMTTSFDELETLSEGCTWRS